MPSASASAATAICTPASNWLTIFTVLPMPAASPRRQTLDAIASSTGAARSNAAGAPEPITVMLPPSAPARPPETGASSISSPASASRASRLRATSGATVVEQITTAPCGSSFTQPCGPNSTSCSCAAFTTRTSTASRSRGRASGRSDRGAAGGDQGVPRRRARGRSR